MEFPSIDARKVLILVAPDSLEARVWTYDLYSANTEVLASDFKLVARDMKCRKVLNLFLR